MSPPELSTCIALYIFNWIIFSQTQHTSIHVTHIVLHTDIFYAAMIECACQMSLQRDP